MNQESLSELKRIRDIALENTRSMDGSQNEAEQTIEILYHTIVDREQLKCNDCPGWEKRYTKAYGRCIETGRVTEGAHVCTVTAKKDAA